MEEEPKQARNELAIRAAEQTTSDKKLQEAQGEGTRLRSVVQELQAQLDQARRV